MSKNSLLQPRYAKIIQYLDNVWWLVLDIWKTYILAWGHGQTMLTQRADNIVALSNRSQPGANKTWQSSLNWDMLCALEPQPVLCDIAEQSQLRHVACAPTSTCLVWSKEWMQLAINSDDLPWFQVMLLEVMWVSKDFDVFTFFGPSRHPIKLCVDSCEECLSGHTYIVASV